MLQAEAAAGADTGCEAGERSVESEVVGLSVWLGPGARFQELMWGVRFPSRAVRSPAGGAAGVHGHD